jgi:PleD family two-component response regulator
LEVASGVAKRICAEVFHAPFKDSTVSVSVGIGQWVDEYASPKGFLHAVDQALYRAKRAGGKKIFACNPNGKSPAWSRESGEKK